MDFVTVLISVSLIHCAVFFLDTLFKSCSHYPYLYFLQNTGLQVQAFQLRWFTTAFNRFFQKCGSWRPRFLDLWFSIGAKCSLILLPISIYIVINTAVDTWRSNTGIAETKSTLVLEPMVPGLNLPFSDIGYYVTTILICSVIHEFGHAVAAVREDVHISGIGLVVLLIIPVVYVHLSTEQYEALPAKKQLLVICAGVWHNIVLAVAAVMLLTVLPTLLYPFFEIGSGVLVTDIQKGSPVLGPSGLLKGDKIVAINQCQVKDYDSWHQCILSAARHSNPGYCVSSDLVRNHDESVSVKQLPGGVVECCSTTNLDHLCFEYLEKEGNMPELPQHSCLPGRIVIESTDTLCNIASDCIPELHCLKPSLDNQTRLMLIKRASGKIVIFLGYPSEVYHTVQISDFVPKLFFSSPLIPEVLMRLCKYVFLFSSGLAVVNIIPCFYLDGQHIIVSIMNILLAGKVKQKSMRKAIALSITFIGSLFIFGIFCSIMFSSLF